MRLMSLLLLLVLPLGGIQAKELKPYEGPPLPDFTLTDLAGERHSLSDYRGRVVLVNFWATWCPPCVHEMPSMERLRERLAGEPFTILAVDMGEDKPTVDAFLEKVPVGFPVLLDSEGEVLQQWKIFAFPTSFVVGPQGEIRYALYGGIEWDEPAVIATLRELLPPQ